MGRDQNFQPIVFRAYLRGIAMLAALLVVSGGSSGTTDAAPKPFSACSLVNLEDAKGLWDAGAKLDVMDGDHSHANGPIVVVCRYAVLTGQYVEKYLTVEVTRPVTKAQFETARQQDELAFNATVGKVQKVAGLGDEAYSFGFYNFGAVTFLKGQYAVKVTVEYKRDNAMIDPARAVAGIMPVARKAAGRSL